MKINEAVAALKQPIYQTWDQIAADAEPLCEGDNECAVEMCIDAERLQQFVGIEAQQLLRTAIDTFGYRKLFGELCKEIILVG